MSEETVQPPKPVGEPATNFTFAPTDDDPGGAPSPFKPADPSPDAGAPAASDDHDEHDDHGEEITWTASEHIAHQKNPMWYAAVMTVAILLALATFALTRDKISMVTILIVGILFCVAAARKPRILTYALNRDGLTLDKNFHAYGEYRSFSIVHQGAFASIDLLPLKRFMPLTSIYFSPEDEERVVDMLSSHIPYEEHQNSVIDRFFHTIHF